MPTLRVSQGESVPIDVQLRDESGQAVADAYDGSEPLALALYEAAVDVEVAVLGSTAAWLVPAAGTVRIAIDDLDTAAQGTSRLVLRVQDGGEWLDALWATLVVLPPGGPVVPAWTLGRAYVSDEQVYLAAPGDFPRLVPRSGRLAAGADGAVSALDPWLLSSAAESLSGVRPGMVCVLTVGGREETYVVSDALAGAVRLRRPGMGDGEGRPPAPAGAAAVPFAVLTLLPQLQSAAREFDRRYGVGRLLGSSVPAFDVAEVEGASVAYVLARAYLAATENAPQSQLQGFVAKAAFWDRQFEAAGLRVVDSVRDDVPAGAPRRLLGVPKV